MRTKPDLVAPAPLTKREVAIAAVREAILSGRYRAGERIGQNEVASELGLSATPVREAFRELLAQGLLVQRAHHSVRVADIDLAALRQLYEVRGLLEGEAACLAVGRMDDAAVAELRQHFTRMQHGHAVGDNEMVEAADEAFHGLLYGAAGNAVLANLIGQLWSSFPRYVLWAIPGRTQEALAEHRRMLDAVEARDPTAAADAVRHHLRCAYAALRASLSEQPADGGPAS